MYDRQTETLWSHFTGTGMIGELTGVELDDFPLSTVAWSTWRDANPDGLVLSEDTGFTPATTGAIRTPATTTSTASPSSSKARSTAGTRR